MQRLRIVYDSLCSDCSLCREACAAATGREPGIFLNPVGSGWVPLACRQCEHAPCVDVCAPQALFHSGGLVELDAGRCIRCGLCVLACPFGCVELDATGLPVKCQGCPSDQIPACVAACPRRVLSLPEARVHS